MDNLLNVMYTITNPIILLITFDSLPAKETEGMKMSMNIMFFSSYRFILEEIMRMALPND